MDRLCSMNVRVKNAYKDMNRKPEGIKPLLVGLDWVCLCQDAES
jgi:hypothetical protein